MTICQTAKKLGARTYDYIWDRVSGEFKLPSLAQLIEAKVHENTSAHLIPLRFIVDTLLICNYRIFTKLRKSQLNWAKPVGRDEETALNYIRYQEMEYRQINQLDML